MNATVAVIGAGISGLTCAWHLEQLGHKVTVFEASDRPGGLIQSAVRNGYVLDLGPNTIPDRRGTLRHMIKSLGIEDRLIEPNHEAKTRYIVRDGQMVALPSGPSSFASSPFLSNGAKARLLAEVFTTRQSDDVDESLANFIKRHFGQEVLDYALNPFIAGTYGGKPEHLSAQHTFGRLLELEQTTGSIILGALLKKILPEPLNTRATPGSGNLINFDDGEQVLTDAIAQDLAQTVITNHRVEQVRRKDHTWSIDNIETEFDAVVCATEAYTVPKIQWHIHHQMLVTEPFSEIVYPPIANIAMVFKRSDIEHTLDGFGVLVPEVEDMSILGTIFCSTIFENRTPDEDTVLLLTFLGGARQPQMALASEQTRTTKTLNDLQTLLGVKGDPLEIWHQQWIQSIPQYEVGYGRTLERINCIEDTTPCLYFTGNYREGISVSDTAHHAAHTAERFDRRWRTIQSTRRPSTS